MLSLRSASLMRGVLSCILMVLGELLPEPAEAQTGPFDVTGVVTDVEVCGTAKGGLGIDQEWHPLQVEDVGWADLGIGETLGAPHGNLDLHHARGHVGESQLDIIDVAEGEIGGGLDLNALLEDDRTLARATIDAGRRLGIEDANTH